MKQKEFAFGKTTNGRDVTLFRLDGGGETYAEILDYGARIHAVYVPDRKGGTEDVLLGSDTVAGYENSMGYMGATIGRYANRIGGAAFSLNGKTYHLTQNEGKNHLHGGKKAFHTALWEAERIDGSTVAMRYTSPDGEEGYPGALHTTVTFHMDADGSLSMDYEAQCDADTIVNLTNHAYFNLAGQGCGSVLTQSIRINASHFLPVAPDLLPVGTVQAVEDTPMDFKQSHAIGGRIDDDFAQLKAAGGYDHTWVLDRGGGTLYEAAGAYDEASGRRLTVLTTMPGLQFYVENFKPVLKGKKGRRYFGRDAFCMETQFFPDSPTHANFPSAVLRANEKYRHQTVYRFTTD